MATVDVEELPLPRDLDSPGAADFVATVEVRNVCEVEGYGTPELRVTPEKLLAFFHDPHAPRRLFAVRVDGRIVARGLYEWQVDDAEACWLDVRVLPGYRGTGIGTAVAAHVEALARADGRGHAIVYIVSPDGPGPRLAPPTGAGSLPADNPEVRFLLGRGYRLEQIVRASRLPLPVPADELGRRLAAAEERSGPDYRVRSWAGTTPAPFAADLAVLRTRMSTDAPQGALGEPEDVWSADRAVAWEEETTVDGTTLLTAAVEHLADGRLVGFTQLAVPPHPGHAVEQYDTLVLREHRGNALGMLLKLAALRQLQETHPGHPSVLTWNAEENRHMLAVNELLDFAPMGYEGAWRLDLR